MRSRRSGPARDARESSALARDLVDERQRVNASRQVASQLKSQPFLLSRPCFPFPPLLCLSLALSLTPSAGRLGRLLVAIRDDEVRVRFTGYNPTWFKVLVFAISGAIAGVAGAMYTVQTGIITPDAMDVAFSIEMVIWVAVGGRATLVGAILGTLLVQIAQTALSEQFPDFWLFFQGFRID